MKSFLVLILSLLLVCPLGAQQESIQVNSLPDAASWATAFANPALAAYRAIRSDDPQCYLSRLLVSEGIANGTGLLLKHFLKGDSSQRPCSGCARDGMPSGHSWNSVIGSTSGSGWQIGIGASFAVGTGGLRIAANRHTPKQVVMGLLLGAGTEWAGKLVKCGA